MRRGAIGVFLVLILAAFCSASVRAAVVAPIQIPGAFLALDDANVHTIVDAPNLTYMPAAAFEYPGRASLFHPLVLWLRLRATAGDALVTAPGVGSADLYYLAPGVRAYADVHFGMRVPYAQRVVERVPPTVYVPATQPGSSMYLRLALDDESRVVPIVSLVDAVTLRAQDVELERLASTALLFIGIFISLAAANIFVFIFVRESAYAVYSGMMLSNALFAATYLHGSAWHWLWPGLGLPDAATQLYIIELEAIFLLWFARAFMQTRRVVPRADRIALIVCATLLAAGFIISQVMPSMHLGPLLTGRELFLILVGAYLVVVFGLGVVALRAGSTQARFFVASNGVVSLAAGLMAFTNFTNHDVSTSNSFILLMAGQAIEGWLLFGALAYRLRQVLGAHSEEQQRRMLAQAESLAQARALLESRQLAITDQLTGIANRRAFDEAFQREWEHSVRAETPIALMMLDIDFFKRFNDAYGHVGGDECLRQVAAAVAGAARRPSDLAARYGGEEFAVILSDTDADYAGVIAHDILAAVSALQIPHRDSPYGYVSVSIGVASARPSRFEAREELIRAADTQLYAAKAGGRNSISADYTARV